LRKIYLYIGFIISALAYSQQEASVWYFGQNAGLKFQTNGTVTPLSDGQLNTEEGCSSIADANGNLLFYTDGRTVWDRNHVQMPNGSFDLGTELFGDGSSTQSGIIVPKPGDPNIYYIFTVDEPHYQNAAVYPNPFNGNYAESESGQTPTGDDGKNNGFNYSVVDLSVVGNNGSIGNVISRNNHLITYDTNPNGEEIKYKCSEKITAIKNETDGSYWVITHFINKFYAFKVTASGVTTNPVISTVGSSQTLLGYRRNAIGYLKASPNGTKLAIAHQQNGTTLGQSSFGSGSVELFDFDGATGIVSNPITVLPNVQAYGVEFSPSSEKLYATYRIATNQNMELAQFDLLSANIEASKVVVFNSFNYLFALQLAPNNKIYCATGYEGSLGVINDPNQSGLNCNYLQIGQALSSGKLVKLGLPPFITSFFNASFNAENFCLGSPTQFTVNSSTAITGISWDFGDGSPISNILSPTHTYALAGNYNVTMTATSVNGTISKSRTITIAAVPIVANTISNLSQCGNANTLIDLTQFNNSLLGSQSNNTFGVSYFSSLANASNNVNQLPVNHALSIGNNQIFAKVYNISNTTCYAITSFSITLYNIPLANSVSDIFYCDDISNDGIAIFDLQAVKATLLGNQNPGSYNITFHLNQLEADSDINPLALNYQNINNPQTIFARIENNQNQTCFTTTAFQIGLFVKPLIVNPPQDLLQCDENNDNTATFDLSVQNSSVLGSQSIADFNISYHANSADAQTGSNSLSLSYSNTTNPQVVYARLTNRLNTSCYATTQFTLQVKPNPELIFDSEYTICEGTPITLQAPQGFSGYTWSTGDTTNSALITEDGNYSIEVFNNYGTLQCSTTQSFEVFNSNIATITNIIVADWTDNENSITVEVAGDGDYEYSLDGITYQEGNIFNGLRSGVYTVFVNDKKGCGFITERVVVLMYPKFFTPNDDGNNDVWRIKFSNYEPDMEIHIFDRYGKLLTLFKGSNFGWDGTYNGEKMLADDYWFVVKRQDGSEFKGHFSLIR
jgi:gliding motility-associated-like protein